MDLRLPRRELVTGRKHIICASCFLASALPSRCVRALRLRRLRVLGACGACTKVCAAHSCIPLSVRPLLRAALRCKRWHLLMRVRHGTCALSSACETLLLFSSSPGGFASARVRRARCGRTLHARVSGLCASRQPSGVPSDQKSTPFCRTNRRLVSARACLLLSQLSRAAGTFGAVVCRAKRKRCGSGSYTCKRVANTGCTCARAADVLCSSGSHS